MRFLDDLRSTLKLEDPDDYRSSEDSELQATPISIEPEQVEVLHPFFD